MSAAARLAALDASDATDLCQRAARALSELVDVMSRETQSLRAGRYKEAALLTPLKTQLGQDYVTLARTVQREAVRLKAEVPDELGALQGLHERFATQMAENLRVLATVRNVTEDLLSDVAVAVGNKQQPRTYGGKGDLKSTSAVAAKGLSINRAL